MSNSKEMNRNITEYLKKTVLAQIDKSIDFKNGEFYKISREQFMAGQIDPNITLKLFQKSKNYKEKDEYEVENIDENLYILLAVKVIKTEVEGSQKKDEQIEDLTGIFFVPALVNKRTSALLPCLEDNKLPWFPREFLSPMIEPELAIGSLELYENRVSNQIYKIYKIKTWENYLEYCKEIYEQTTMCKFEDDEIYNINKNNETIPLENNVYILLDNAINSTYFIKKLYTDILKQDEIELPLYENFISLEKQNDRLPIENSIENRINHYGQMGGKFGLSFSQREGLNHFQNIHDGEILAIQGPPGTGKTTLLQSIISSKYVESALKQELPPIIVATSTNNQAVTNIIDSFGKIKSNFSNNLGIRWIEGVNSFATYFPSKSKEKDAKEKGFQYTNNKGDFFVKEVDNEINIKASKEKFLREAEKIYNIKTDIKNYQNMLLGTLFELNELKAKLIIVAEKLKNIVGNTGVKEFLELREQNIENLNNKRQKTLERIQFWENKYKTEIPLIWKMASILAKYKLKISNKLKIYANSDENFNKDIISIDFIEEYYAKKIEKINEDIRKENKQKQEVNSYKEDFEKIVTCLEKCFINTADIKNEILINTDKLDEWLDKNVRYISFWIAVHYYEAMWIQGECALTEKQQGTTYKNVLELFYKRLSMITPCLVMTFYKLPGQFEAFVAEDIWEFLYNTIDLLIVDEAGQVSTEIGACSFALAKKALVVGDEKQIEPVWGIDKPLDKTLAIQENVIEEEKDFEHIEKCGITASCSSIMRAACKSSNYSKYDENGLFLSEHRRCFDDIISYCNKLVYKGNLQPLRGNGEVDALLPKMGYYLIKTEKSEKIGTSRINTIEAVGIARWLLENAEIVFEYYKKLAKNNKKNPDDVDLSKIIGVITPFKEQIKELKKAFQAILPQYIYDKITFGTVHTFQGGERKVIILSTTYGAKDGCFFIDYKKNLMNVAVSRAEDSFLVFGSVDCLKDEETSPSGLLRKSIIGNQIESKLKL